MRGTPAPTRPSPLRWWQELIVVFVAYQAFEVIRSAIKGSASVADRNARSIIRLERALWLYHEHRWQSWVLPHHLVVEALDFWYGTMHFVAPPLVLWWLWKRFPDRYGIWRNALVATSVLSLILFAAYPLTPPRLLPPTYGFVDTLRTIGGLGVLDSKNFKDTNSYAAMPSLHLAWSTWCAFVMASTVRSWYLKILAFGYPAITLFVVAATANHYLLDAVGGWVALLLGWAAARAARHNLHRRGKRRTGGTMSPRPVAESQGGEDAYA